MALNTRECQAMVDACRLTGVPLFVAYYRLALPRFLKAKELVVDRAIGALRFIEVLMTQPLQVHPADQLPWRLRPEIAGAACLSICPA